MAGVWVKPFPTWASDYPRTSTLASVVVKKLSIRTSPRLLWTDTLACDTVVFLSPGTLWSRFRALTLTGVVVKLLSSRTFDNVRTLTLTRFIVERLRVGTGSWAIRTNTLTVTIIKFLGRCACRPWPSALALTGIWIESLPSRTFQKFWASALAGFLFEHLGWVGTCTNLVGTFAVTSALVKNKRSCADLDRWTLTHARLFIEDFRFGTVLSVATDAVADLVAKYLISGAVFESRTNALAVSITVLKRQLTHSIVVALTSATFIIENPWRITEHLLGTLALARV